MSSDAPVSPWVQKLRARFPDVLPTLDATTPHPRFRYPASAALTSDGERTAAQLRDLLFPLTAKPTTVRFFRSPREALIEGARRRGRKTGFQLLLAPFAPRAFTEAARILGAQVTLLPREPEAWEDFPFGDFAELWISNPNSTDGFFYPEAFYLQLAAFVARHKPLHLVSEESTGVFSFNPTPPGHLRSFLGDPRVTILSSAWPCYQPLGPDLAWAMDARGSDPETLVSEELPAEVLTTTLPVIRSFQLRQGGSYAEVTRRLLAVDLGLRVFGDELRPLPTEKNLRPLLWPETGFFMVFDASQLLRERGQDIETLCTELFTGHGILIEPGTLYGQPTTFRICYAMPHGTLQRLARGLKGAWLGPSLHSSLT